VSAVATGQLWRLAGEQALLRARPWATTAGLTLTLPLAVAATLWATESAQQVDRAIALPWYHGAGVLLLGVGWLLLRSKARSDLARENIQAALAQQDKQLHLALDSMGGGRWEWDVINRRFRCYGSFYES